MEQIVFYAVASGLAAAGVVYVISAFADQGLATKYVHGGDNLKVNQVLDDDLLELAKADEMAATESFRRTRARTRQDEKIRRQRWLATVIDPRAKMPLKQKQDHSRGVGNQFETDE